MLSMFRRKVLRRMALMPVLGVQWAESRLSLGTRRRGVAAGGELGGGEDGKGGGGSSSAAWTSLLGEAGDAEGLAITESWLRNQ
jgi:hypothetical protein